jgi:hypothetical protein
MNAMIFLNKCIKLNNDFYFQDKHSLRINLSYQILYNH